MRPPLRLLPCAFLLRRQGKTRAGFRKKMRERWALSCGVCRAECGLCLGQAGSACFLAATRRPSLSCTTHYGFVSAAPLRRRSSNAWENPFHLTKIQRRRRLRSYSRHGRLNRIMRGISALREWLSNLQSRLTDSVLPFPQHRSSS